MNVEATEREFDVTSHTQGQTGWQQFLFKIVGLIIQTVIKLLSTIKLIVLKVKTLILCDNIFARSS